MGLQPWSPSLPHQLPSPFQHYRLIRLLGEGGQGKVYLATDAREPGELFAMKFPILPQDYDPARDRPRIDAFIQEAMIGRRLRSRFLGHTYDVLDLREYPDYPPAALVMPFYPIGLEDLPRLFPGGFSVQQIITWSRQLAMGLADLHERHVHRDLTPGNIRFAFDDLDVNQLERPETIGKARATITDFGTLGPLRGESRWIVFHDRWKDAKYYPERPGDLDERGRLPPQHCSPAMDIYSFGKMLREFVPLCHGPTDWLVAAAERCEDDNPARRPRAAELINFLSIDWNAELTFIRESANLRPEEHDQFEGRAFIMKQEFNQFVRSCGDQGGVFVIVGPPGVGKSALLTHWAWRTGQPIGYYFRYRDNMTSPESMPVQIATQLKRRFKLDDPIPAEADKLTRFLEDLCTKILNRAEGPRRLLLFVDGLDEARDPALAAKFLPKSLPNGAYVIASSRPASNEAEDQVGLLRDAGATVFELDPRDKRNGADLKRFFNKRLRGIITKAQAAELADRCGGLFLLAHRLVEEVRKAMHQSAAGTIAEFLDESRGWGKLDATQRLFDSYRLSWKRFLQREPPGTEEELSVLAALLAAAQGWVSEDWVARLLEWYETQHSRALFWTEGRLRRFLGTLTWFIDSRDNPDDPNNRFFQIRHQSVRDYFLSAKGPVPQRLLRRMHAAIGAYYQHEARGSRGERGEWQRMDPYGRFFAVRHLLAAGDRESARQAAELLAHLDYLQGTLGEEPPESDS
jgi:hypothetical protein